MRIAVVGCKGFLGATFTRFAAAKGHELLGFARSSQPDADHPGQFESADATYTDLAPALARFKPAAVLHAAGAASVAASLAAPVDDLRAALLTFANTLDAVRRAGVDCLTVFPSSAAVYGDPLRLPVPEEAPLAPLSPYGFHKLACEVIATEYAQVYGLRVAVARLFSLYGPRQRRLLLWELFAQATSAVTEVVLAGTGEESRDYLHADDACAALLSLATAPQRQKLIAVNVASGQQTSTGDLARLVVAAVAPHKKLLFRGEARPGDPPHWQADVRKLSAIHPGEPRPLFLGVEQCVRDWAAERPSK
jgi:UDP-glucose 4-epimerase